MLLKGTVLILSSFMVGLAYLAYKPLPEGITDTYKTYFFFGIMNIVNLVVKVKEDLGYSGYLEFLRSFQASMPMDLEPKTAKYGDLKVTRERIAGIPVIMYSPNKATGLSPAFVYLHGGGWVALNPDVYDTTVYHMAKHTNTIVFSVDYRLAPEHPFPASIDDCLEVTRYILRHGEKYGVDVSKVGVAGDSAGGNMAASVALQLHKEKSDLPPLKFQVILYPAMQAFDLRLPSLLDLNDTVPILSTRRMIYYYIMYLGLEEKYMNYYIQVMADNRHISPDFKKKYSKYLDVKLLPEQFQKPNKKAPAISNAPYDEELFSKIKNIVVDPLFSPLMAPDLSGLPPAFVYISEFDILRDDGLLYARRLKEAGNRVEEYLGRGGYHGDILKLYSDFLMPTSGVEALKEIVKFINDVKD